VNGAVGVPFHEISHLIFALIFLHRIVEVHLFRPFKGKQDGRLGYIVHTYTPGTPNSAWKMVGNLFIGIAPMIMGSGIMFAVLLIFYPEYFNIGISFNSEYDLWTTVKQSFYQSVSMFSHGAFFTLPMLFLTIFAIFVCPHLGMSKEDLKGSLLGTLSLIFVAWLVPFYLVSWKKWLTYESIVSGLTVFTIYYIYILFIGLVISLFVMGFHGILSLFAPKDKQSAEKSKKSAKSHTNDEKNSVVVNNEQVSQGEVANYG
jgi:hypothetical protein